MRLRCSAIVALLLLIAACACTPALAGGNDTSGQVYTWVDKNGVRHYSDQPHDTNAKVLKLPTAATAPAKPAVKPTATVTATPPRTVQTAAAATVESPKARAARCATLRDQVERLQSARRVEVTENGVSRFVAGDELVAFKKEMQKKMHAACTPPGP